MRQRYYTQDAYQAGLAFLLSQTSYIEAQVVAQPYPDILYPSLIPVDTSANQWAKSVTYISTDGAGKADWFHHMAKDLPLADVMREKHEVGIEMAGIGYRYTLEEIGQAMMIPNTNLQADRAAVARRLYEEFIDGIAFLGDTQKGWFGLVNHPSVPTSTVPVGGGAGATTAWETKTAEEILADVNAILTGVYVESNTVEVANTLLLPIQSYTLLATKLLPNSSMSLLAFLQSANAYTGQTGQPLTIRGVRGLDTASAADQGRMVAYRRDPTVVKMHIPMPHQFMPVWQTGPLIFDVPGIFRVGGVEVRRPAAVRYADGIYIPAP